jgi:hypothetical protein
MTAVSNHRERQLLQYLRGRGWVKAYLLPQHYKTLDGMLQKHWIEKAGEGRDLAFRITEQGMIAKTALGSVDSWDSQISRSMIQGCFLGGSLGCAGSTGFEGRASGYLLPLNHHPGSVTHGHN